VFVRPWEMMIGEWHVATGASSAGQGQGVVDASAEMDDGSETATVRMTIGRARNPPALANKLLVIFCCLCSYGEGSLFLLRCL